MEQHLLASCIVLSSSCLFTCLTLTIIFPYNGPVEKENFHRRWAWLAFGGCVFFALLATWIW